MRLLEGGQLSGKKLERDMIVLARAIGRDGS